MNPSRPGAFSFGRLFIVDSIYLIDIGLFRLPISFHVNFDRLCLSRNWSISSTLLNLWAQICLQYYLIILLMSMGSIAMSPLSFLILVICVLSLFFLAWLQAYQLYQSFQRTSFWFCCFSLLISCFQFHWFQF